jgi:hypothetical protein
MQGVQVQQAPRCVADHAMCPGGAAMPPPAEEQVTQRGRPTPNDARPTKATGLVKGDSKLAWMDCGRSASPYIVAPRLSAGEGSGTVCTTVAAGSRLSGIRSASPAAYAEA